MNRRDFLSASLAAAAPAPPARPNVLLLGRSQRAVLTISSTDTGNAFALIEGGISGVSLPEAPSFDGGAPDVWTLRTPAWRLSYYPSLKTGELYDLGEDPGEFVNVWNRPGIERTRGSLKEELLDRILAAHDPLPARERPY